MPTNYVPNGTTQVNGLTWDDQVKWLINVLPTGRFVWVLNSQQSAPVEVMSGDPTTGALTIGTFNVATLNVPTMKVDTLNLDIANADVILARDAANTLALRNGVNAQSFLIYNTFTNAANYERGFFRYVGNALRVGHEAAGTGNVTRSIQFETNSGSVYFGISQQGGFVNVNSAGHLVFGVDNNNDIGTSGAVRPRNLFLAGPAVNGAVTIGAGGQVTSNALTNGQMLIGSTGAAPVAAGLTAGTGISVTPAAGAITIAATGATLVYDRAFAVTITNTAAETTIYTKSVAGNTLGATQKFRLTLLGKITCTEVAATATFTLRCKLGGTTLTTQTLTVSAVTSTTSIGSNQPYKAVFEVQNLNVTNSQTGITVLDSAAMSGALGANAYEIVGTGADGVAAVVITAHTTARGTSAIDMTAAQTLLVSGQWDTNNVNRSFTMDSTIVEQL